jgi:hypothetical protein
MFTLRRTGRIVPMTLQRPPLNPHYRTNWTILEETRPFRDGLSMDGRQCWRSYVHVDYDNSDCSRHYEFRDEPRHYDHKCNICGRWQVDTYEQFAPYMRRERVPAPYNNAIMWVEGDDQAFYWITD